MNSTYDLKKHQCDKCSFASSRTFNLQRHYNRKHGINGQGLPQHREGTNIIDPNITAEHSRLKDEYANLIAEYSKLKDDFISLRNEYELRTQDQFAYH